MFRSLLAPSRKLLMSRAATLTPSVTLYDVRRSNPAKDHNPLLHGTQQVSLRSLLETEGILKSHTRSASTPGFQVPNPSQLACQFINMVKCVDLNNLKDAPVPTFYVIAATAALQLGFPFLELIGGYSPLLTYTQLYTAAMSLAFNGGKKWGLAVSSNPEPTPTWETMGWSMLPPGFALVALILPYPLGFLTMIMGLLTSLFLDLKSCMYPPWGTAATYFMTLTSVVGLTLAMFAYILFHKKDGSKKKQKERDAADSEEFESEKKEDESKG